MQKYKKKRIYKNCLCASSWPDNICCPAFFCLTVKANCRRSFADSEAEKAPLAGVTRQRASLASALVVIPLRMNGFYNNKKQVNAKLKKVVIPLRMNGFYNFVLSIGSPIF